MLLVRERVIKQVVQLLFQTIQLTQRFDNINILQFGHIKIKMGLMTQCETIRMYIKHQLVFETFVSVFEYFDVYNCDSYENHFFCFLKIWILKILAATFLNCLYTG